jgi:hypothetical protein
LLPGHLCHGKGMGEIERTSVTLLFKIQILYYG